MDEASQIKSYERPKSHSVHRTLSQKREIEQRVREATQTQKHLTVGESASQRERERER